MDVSTEEKTPWKVLRRTFERREIPVRDPLVNTGPKASTSRHGVKGMDTSPDNPLSPGDRRVHRR